MQIKRHWIGERWYVPGVKGNDINKVSAPPRPRDGRRRETKLMTVVPLRPTFPTSASNTATRRFWKSCTSSNFPSRSATRLTSSC